MYADTGMHFTIHRRNEYVIWACRRERWMSKRHTFTGFHSLEPTHANIGINFAIHSRNDYVIGACRMGLGGCKRDKKDMILSSPNHNCRYWHAFHNTWLARPSHRSVSDGGMDVKETTDLNFNSLHTHACERCYQYINVFAFIYIWRSHVCVSTLGFCSKYRPFHWGIRSKVILDLLIVIQTIFWKLRPFLQLQGWMRWSLSYFMEYSENYRVTFLVT
jgi:ribosomal protein L37AE/L43A